MKKLFNRIKMWWLLKTSPERVAPDAWSRWNAFCESIDPNNLEKY